MLLLIYAIIQKA